MTRPETAVVEDVWRRESPYVLAALLRRHGDLGDCEDAAQEALAAAAVQWAADGVPDHPRGWLIRGGVAAAGGPGAGRPVRERPGRSAWPSARTGGRPARSRGRRRRRRRTTACQLLLLCCHPALRPPSQVALTLRAVAGLSTAQVAAAFLVPEPTMAPAAQPGPRDAAGGGRAVRRAGARGAAGPGRRVPGGPAPRVQRGVRGQLGRAAARHVADRRGDPADPRAARGVARPRRGDRRARADAADRGAGGDPDRRAWRPRPAGGAGPLAGGTRERSPRASRCSRRCCPAATSGGSSCRPRSPPCTRRRRPGPTPTGARSACSTGCSSGSRPARPSRSTAPWPSAWPSGRSRAVPWSSRCWPTRPWPGTTGRHAVRAHLLELAGDREAALGAYGQAARLTASIPEQRYLNARAGRLTPPQKPDER